MGIERIGRGGKVMIYREISVARVMRLLALKQTSNLFFQDANLGLKKLVDYEWNLQELTKRRFFEKEGK